MDKYNSKIAKYIGELYGKDKWAITISKKTTLYSCDKNLVGDAWRRHENCHKNQFVRKGWVLFVCSYLWETFKNGYFNNKYEIEARDYGRK